MENLKIGSSSSSSSNLNISKVRVKEAEDENDPENENKIKHQRWRDNDDYEEEDDDEEEEEDRSIKLGSATMVSCVANLSNTILGTGMLAMAHGFSQGGLILGWLTVLICGLMGYFGLYLLSLCASHPSIPHRNSSFFEISKLTYPRAGIFFDSAIAIKCFGVSISYLLIFGKLMPQVITSFHGPFNKTLLNPKTGEEELTLPLILDRKFWITISMTILVPLSFLRRLDSLRYTSYIALIAVINLILVVSYYKFFRSSEIIDPGPIELIKVDTGFLTALPLFVFAYTCAQNLFSVHNELQVNTVKKKQKVIQISIGSAILIYEFIGTVGYLTFGSKVSSNLISDYPHSIFISISRLSISILVLFSYPLQIHPCRNSLVKVFLKEKEKGPKPDTNRNLDDRDRRKFKNKVLNDRDDDGESENVGRFKGVGNGDDGELGDGGRGEIEEGFNEGNDDDQEVDEKIFFGITIGLLLSSFLISINVQRLETVLGFVGSTGSTTISYILPGFYFLKLFPIKDEERIQAQEEGEEEEGSYRDLQEGEELEEEEESSSKLLRGQIKDKRRSGEGYRDGRSLMMKSRSRSRSRSRRMRRRNRGRKMMVMTNEEDRSNWLFEDRRIDDESRRRFEDKLRLIRLLAKVLILSGFLIMIVCLSLNIKDAFFSKKLSRK